MTKDELWKYITDRNPDFLTAGAHLAPAGLKQFFNTSYDVGYRNGCNDSYEVHSNVRHEIPEFLKGILK